ncbi:hypothetical protein DOY81_009277, partial [Sarcophaga bullata]
LPSTRTIRFRLNRSVHGSLNRNVWWYFGRFNHLPTFALNCCL